VLPCGRKSRLGSAKTADEIKNYRDDDAEQKGSSQGKVDNCVSTPVGEISGQTAERQSYTSSKQQYCAQQYNHAANNEQQLAQITHKNILAGYGGGVLCASPVAQDPYDQRCERKYRKR
jgi:hypothetical protein